MKLERRRCCFVVGPTASGKSAIAAELAARLGSVVINADAYQVYRGLETLTAVPSATEMARAPHQRFSFVDPTQEWSAHQHLQAVTPLLDDRDAPPAIITGGSGLYLKFISHGPSSLPPSNPTLRAELEQESLESLYQRLHELDPAGAAVTDPRNRRYVTRNLEICLLTGRPFSELNSPDWQPSLQTGVTGFALQWERGELTTRIARRTKDMLDEGAIDEVRALENPSKTCARAIGIAQIQAYLGKQSTRAECEENINIATRQYAKRQRTWFKREQDWLQPISMGGTDSPTQIAGKILSKL